MKVKIKKSPFSKMKWEDFERGEVYESDNGGFWIPVYKHICVDNEWGEWANLIIGLVNVGTGYIMSVDEQESRSQERFSRTFDMTQNTWRRVNAQLLIDKKLSEVVDES